MYSKENTFLHIRLGFLPLSPVLENLDESRASNDVMQSAVMTEVVNSYATIKKVLFFR